MAPTPSDKAKDAHYHVVQATVEWAAFAKAMLDEATNSVDERSRKDEQRKRETTYARDELGGH